MNLQSHPAFETSELSEAQAGAARLGIDVRLNPVEPTEGFKLSVTRLALGSAELCYCRHHGRLKITGEANPNSYFLCVSLSGKIRFRTEDGECSLEPGNPTIIPTHAFTATTEAATETMLVRLARPAVRSVLRDLVGHQVYTPLAFDAAHAPPATARVQLLNRFLEFLYEEADRSSPSLLFSLTAQEQAENLLATLMLETLPHNYSSEISMPGSQDVPWHLKAADEVIRERLSEMTSTAKLAQAVGVSPKMLRRAFVQIKGVTPNRYLRKLRFERVHKELQQASPPETVTTIALKWGFYHLGRFAVEYRRVFSECPSQTLRAS